MWGVLGEVLVRDANRAADVCEYLTDSALLLEGRALQAEVIKFPEPFTGLVEIDRLTAMNAISHGGIVTGKQLGGLLYYIADILENVDNWQ